MKELIEELSIHLNALLPGRTYDTFSEEIAEILSKSLNIQNRELAKELGHAIMIGSTIFLIGGLYTRNKRLTTIGLMSWIALIAARILKGLNNKN